MVREQEHPRVTLAELSRCVGRHPVQITRQWHLEVAEIALMCGFSDQSHFTNAFRRVTGMPPRQYRLHVWPK